MGSKLLLSNDLLGTLQSEGIAVFTAKLNAFDAFCTLVNYDISFLWIRRSVTKIKRAAIGERAKALRERVPRVGTISTATDAAIRKALNNSDVGMRKIATTTLPF
jgi:hypothetical protein